MDGRLTLAVLLVISLLAGALVWTQMREADPEKGARLFKTAFTKERVDRILEHPPLDTQVGRDEVRKGLAWDYLFIPFYAFFLWTTIKLATAGSTVTPVFLSRWAAVIPLVAATLDAIENRGILAILRKHEGALAREPGAAIVEEHAAWWLPALVSACALLTIALAVGTLLYILISRVRARFARPKASRRRDRDELLDFDRVLAAEHAALDVDERHNRVVGLAMSGGGIRSATFNLGILQAFARLGLLTRLDYLSSVSGGGYIASWLSQWLRREQKGGSTTEPIEKVEEQLAREPDQLKPEPDPVLHLRNYSNYLTPRLGVLSADTWTTVATYVRNFLLNLVIIVALTGLVLLVPRAVVDWLRFLKDEVFPGTPFSHFGVLTDAGISEVWAALAAVLLAGLAILGIGISLAGAVTREADPEDGLTSQGSVQRLVILPLIVSSIFGGYWLARIDTDGSALLWIGLTAVLYVASWLLSVAVAVLVSNERNLRPFVELGGRMTLWAIPVGLVGGALLMGVNRWVAQQLDGPPLNGPPGYLWSDWQVVAFCPPLLLSLFTLIAVLHIGLAGRGLDDYLREWLARAGAWITIYSLGWLALTGLAFYGPVVVATLAPWAKGALASGWLGASAAGAVAGNAQQQGSTKPWHGFAAKFAPWIFIVGLIVAVSWGFDLFLSRQHKELWQKFTTVAEEETAELDSDSEAAYGATRPTVASLIELHDELLDGQIDRGEFWWWILGLAAAACLFSARVAINEFSMHQYYRNRLVRAYLGASNRRRQSNPFTGFDPEDDTDLGLADPPRPFHLVNATLNLVHGERLGWQERKAASFTFSPLHSGYELAADEDQTTPQSAYRGTDTARGLTVGTAMAISGAAASPNMGYRSTPALTLLLTVFNVRLGWWLGNPRYRKAWQRGGPVFALRPLVSELFGLTSDRARDIYLSDGGHFENLGIYELVRRRCRFIISTDAGADPDLVFTDLANAIRKCRTDFGVEIEIDVDAIASRSDDGHSRRHCAVGRISYPRRTRADGTVARPESGWLLFIKASTTGDEPEDVTQYSVANPTFPHQTTADQFFDESQFESYRRLGLHVGHRVLGTAAREAKGNWEALFKKLYQRWYTPTVPVEGSFAQHGRTLAGLFDRLGSDPKLAFLAPQIYQEWDGIAGVGSSKSGIPVDDEERRAGFFFCSSLIQLMENVYLELRLDEEHSSPDNRGWMQLFRRWATSPMLQATWAISAGTYGSRFQSFCERRLDLRQGEVDLLDPADEEAIERIGATAPRAIRDEVRDRSASEEIEWRELRLRAPGMEFPVGFSIVSRKEEGENRNGYVYYLFIDPDLRRSGLAERGLRRLQRRLADDGFTLTISDDPNHRLANVDEHRWLKFQHFFSGSLES